MGATESKLDQLPRAQAEQYVKRISNRQEQLEQQVENIETQLVEFTAPNTYQLSPSPDQAVEVATVRAINQFYSKCIKRPALFHTLNPGPCEEAGLNLMSLLVIRHNLMTVKGDMAEINQFVRTNQSSQKSPPN